MGPKHKLTAGETAASTFCRPKLRHAAIGILLVPTALAQLDTGVADSSLANRPQPVPASDLATPKPAPTLEVTAKSKPEACTTIRRRPEEIMFGVACRKNARAALVDSGYGDRGWSYNAVVVNGIYKCGYIKDGVLPRLKKPRPRAVNHCRDYYPTVAKQRLTILNRINCAELLPGIEGCRDGAAGSKLSARCSDQKLYGNYASDEPSPLNVFGTGNGGFSEPLGKIKTLIHFRAQLSAASQDEAAAVVRAHKWGVVARSCVRNNYLSGGTISRLTPGQVAVIMANPTSRAALQKLEQERATRLSGQR